MSIVRAGGNTYFHKDNLKQMGFRWNLIEKRWEVESQFVTAQIKEYFLANNLELIGFVDTPLVDVSWPLGLTPYPYQVEGARFALERNATLIADEMGLGKGHPHGTPICTPSGWKNIEDLSVGDEVIGSNGKPIKITGVYPRGILEIFKVSMNDGSWVCVDADHLWSVQHVRNCHRNPDKWITKSTESIARDLRDRASNLTWKIPIVKPVEYAIQQQKLPIDPYVLGVLLGNGQLKSNNVHFSTGDCEIVEKIGKRLPLGCWVSNHLAEIEHNICSDQSKRPNQFESYRNPIRKALDEMGLICKTRGKFIPEIYLRSSVSERMDLLHGLMDTDGSSTGVINEYTTVSDVLANNVQELVESLGGIVRRGIKKIENGFLYRLNIKLLDCPFSLSRKVDKWKAPTKYKTSRNIKTIQSWGHCPVICLSVDAEDRLYVTKNFIVTHNTIQALLVLRHCKGMALIVCPASLKINWLRELRKWAPEQEAQTTIVSWASLGKLIGEFYELVIGDECHAIKHSTSKRCQNFKKICVRARKKIFLTGTPVMAKPEDIFNLLQIAGHPLGKSEWAFKFRYCGFFENEYGKLERGDPQNLDELKQSLKGFMIRRLKCDVLKFLPPKTRELRDIEVQDEHLELLITAEGYAAKKRKVSEKKKRLFEQHEIDIDNMSAIRSELAKLKAPHAVERILEMMEEIDSLVVFWCHKDPLYYCVKELEEFNPVFVNGDIKLEERQANVDKFQSGESKIIFLTYAAGAEGITLTRASNMLMCELDWTPSKMLQGEDRCSRIGQNNAVRIEYLTFENSLDHKILDKVMEKTDIISQIIDGENLSSLVDIY